PASTWSSRLVGPRGWKRQPAASASRREQRGVLQRTFLRGGLGDHDDGCRRLPSGGKSGLGEDREVALQLPNLEAKHSPGAETDLVSAESERRGPSAVETYWRNVVA